MANNFDIIIVGGGVLGSSIAYNLMNDGFNGSIAVFEKDKTYSFASTTLSGGGYRTTFTTEINMRIGKYCLEVFENFKNLPVYDEPADIDLKQCGYLFLLGEDKLPIFKKVVNFQRKVGIDSYLLSPQELLDVIPELNTSGVSGGVYSPRDGIFDPYSLLQWYIKQSKRLGVNYINNEIKLLLTTDYRTITGVETTVGEKYYAPIVINAAGAWSGDLSKTIGLDIPVKPLRRQLFHISTQKAFNKTLPFTFDVTGALFRHEGSKVMAGWSRDIEYGYCYNWEKSYFEDDIWPVLSNRCSNFDQVKLERGWAGLYEYNYIDHNGIVGQHPLAKGYYLATGFSGHGVMQAPAVGKGISELIRKGRYETIDLTELAFERFENKKLVIETTVV